MKKIIAISLIVSLLFLLSACNTSKMSKTEDSVLSDVCSSCGEEIEKNNKFCPNCGLSVKETNNGIEDVNSIGLPMDMHESYTILSYLKSTTDEPLIMYNLYNISKDEEVNNVYVIKNGQCRKYHCTSTLGELSKMTDAEIINMLEQKYKDGLDEAISIWRGEYNTKSAIESGKVKLYQPRYYDIQGCLLTDDTGNTAEGEILIFPTAGIGGSPYVIEYPQHSEDEDKFMNYYGTNLEIDSPWDIKFSVEYFGTGNGLESDINNIGDLYYITDDSILTGTVYDSIYYGFDSAESEWTESEGILCFRDENAYALDLRIDNPSSSDVTYIDPSENDMLSIFWQYYHAYYSSFDILK